MTITAKVIEDSQGPKTRRLTTFQLKYPRFIHAEFMTHRQFSRNASSSRAIPVERQIEMILEDTAMPIHWGKNQSGMQADETTDEIVRLPPWWRLDGLDKPLKADAEGAWFHARDKACEAAQAFHDAGYHKQIVNRILEPFSHISVVVTSSQYDNFFSLRRHKDAQPEIKALSDAMFAALDNSTPQVLRPGEWHLPYVTKEERRGAENVEVGFEVEEAIKISVARCARVSYLTHDGSDPSIDADLALYERLVGMVPLHASPAEHQATPDVQVWGHDVPIWERPDLHGNLDGGWRQFRKYLDDECVDNWEQ
jgi:hypothetical protein